MTLRRVAPALLLLGLLASPAGARQEPAAPPPPQGRAAQGQPDNSPGTPTDADRALEQGRYDDAEKMYRRAVEAGGKDAAAAWTGLARVLRETGRIPQALEAAAKAVETGDRGTAALVLLGNLRAAGGDLEGAEKTLREAVAGSATSASARTALGDLLRGTGRRKDALAAYLAANQIWADGGAEEPSEMTAVVRARFSIFELDPEYRQVRTATFQMLDGPYRAGLAEAIVLKADLLTRDDKTGKVADVLKPLLLRNPLHPDALAVHARARVRRFESDDAADLARKALTVDPTHPGAIEVLALLRFGDGDRKGAVELVKRGLAARPKDRALLALAAIPAYLAGDRPAYDAATKSVLEIDPLYGRAFDLCARVLEDQRRFAEAAELAKRAVEIDPADPEGWFSLARNLLNLGREKEAKEALARAEKGDPWENVFRGNFATVLDELDEYATSSTEHFTLRIHAAEDAALRPLYAKALEESLRDLRARYSFDPEVPVLVEVFKRADAFSARTLGVPGFGAVGACFGKVITLDSPGALPPGAFCWRSTLHHELAHVFHIQMTKGRVPRWFTEGLSVHEEEVSNPAWNRNMDRDLVDALANGTVRGLGAIDSAFRGDVMWAYYQSGLMLGWMEREFGWERVREMLALYAKDVDNAGAVSKALGLSPAEFDERFLAECRRKTAGWSVRPRWSEARMLEFRRRSEKDAKDLDAHLHLGEACLQRNNAVDAGSALARARAVAPDEPWLTELRGWLALSTLKTQDRGRAILAEALGKGRDHFDLRMELGRAAEAKGSPEEAVEHFRRAKMQFPRAQGPADPRRELSRIYLGLGRRDEAVKETEEAVAMSETEIEGRLVLARVRESANDPAGAAKVLREIVDIRPLSARGGRGQKEFAAAEVHARLGRSLAQIDRHAEAADALRLAVIVGRTGDPKPEDSVIAAWLVELAKSARASGRVAEAKGALQDALRTDPKNAEAADLLRALGDG
jgi:tetratricopeptide (TPR) repeat protein